MNTLVLHLEYLYILYSGKYSLDIVQPHNNNITTQSDLRRLEENSERVSETGENVGRLTMWMKLRDMPSS